MTTLLTGINELLKRTGEISGDAQELTTLIDSARQHKIDVAVQVYNELIDELYEASNVSHPTELDENTNITLVTSDRDYTLPTDLVQIRWPLIDQTNGRYLAEYPGGYDQLIIDQPIPENFTGLATHAAIRSTDGLLYLDRLPTANETGLIYKLFYDKDLSLSLATDTFPFTDAVFRAVMPAAANMLRWSTQNDDKPLNRALFRSQIGRAARLLSRQQTRERWNRSKSVGRFTTDPLEA